MSKSLVRVFLCFAGVMLVFGVLTVADSWGQTSTKAKRASHSGDRNAKVNLNTASEKELDNLPGVGPATAKKIVAGRPYSSVDDLSKAGLSTATIKKITPLVTVSGASAGSESTKVATAAIAKPTKTTDSNAKMDLNTASEKELDSLPGVGSATAKKIISGRPYSSVDDLSKSGVSASTIKKILPLVMVSGDAVAAASPKASTPVSRPHPAAPSQPVSAAASKTTPGVTAEGNSGLGMVWVNLDSGVYHYEGSRYYGKTKSGKYMSEAEAVKAGYHAAKNEKKPQ